MTNLLKTFLYIFLVNQSASCGVEAGNPGDNESGASVEIKAESSEYTTSTLELNLLEENQSSFHITLESIYLTGKNASGETSYVELKSLSDSYDLFSSSELLLASSNIPAGDYTAVTLIFDADRPFDYRPKGDKRNVSFADSAHRSISIPQTFSVSDGSEEEIILEFDLKSSLVEDGDNFVFKPHIQPHRKKRVTHYSGEITDTDKTAIAVCAYGYRPTLGGELTQKQQFTYDLNELPPPPPGVEGTRPPFYDTKESVVFDESLPCKGAFRSVPVDDKEYRFRRLRPGLYVMRAFFEDGSFKDIEEDLQLRPPPSKNSR